MENKIAKKKLLSNVALHMNGEKCFLGFLKNVMHYLMTLKGLGDPIAKTATHGILSFLASRRSRHSLWLWHPEL